MLLIFEFADLMRSRPSHGMDSRANKESKWHFQGRFRVLVQNELKFIWLQQTKLFNVTSFFQRGNIDNKNQCADENFVFNQLHLWRVWKVFFSVKNSSKSLPKLDLKNVQIWPNLHLYGRGSEEFFNTVINAYIAYLISMCMKFLITKHWKKHWKKA